MTSLWSLGVPWTALGSCPELYLLTLLALLLALFLTRISGRIPAAASFFLLAATAWGLRDRHHLLGDTRLWIDSIRAFGTAAPIYREPLAARLLGALSTLLSPWFSTETVLAGLSVLLGLGVAALLQRSYRSGDPAGKPGSGPALALVFLQPLSFVFFGYTETYPLLLAAAALFLVTLKRDLERSGRPDVWTCVLLVLAGATHYLGALLAIPLAALVAGGTGARSSAAGGAGSDRRTLAVWGALVAGAAFVLAVIPGIREHSTWTRSWTSASLPAYLLQAGNAWALLFVTPFLVFVAAPGARGTPRAPFETFLRLAALTYAVLPLFAHLELGVYRDLDVLSPAFLALTFLAYGRLVRDGRPRRRAAAALLPGLLLLAGWLTLGRCPAGVAWFETMLESPALTPTGRSYGYELLSDFDRRSGDHAAALRRMEAAVRGTPGNTRLQGPLGMARLAAGDTAAAIESLRRAAETARRLDFTPVLAEILIRRGAADEALQLLRPDREAGIADRRFSTALAIAYLVTDHPDSAVLVCDAHLARDPDDAIGHFNRASGLSQMGRADEALAEVRRAAALDPGNEQIRRRLDLLTR